MAMDITRKAVQSEITGQAKRVEFVDASATTAWTDSGMGAAGISSLRALIYATAAVAAVFSVEVAEDGAGLNPVQIGDLTNAVSAPAAYEIKGIVPVAGKDFFRIVRGGTSATFDAVVDLA